MLIDRSHPRKPRKLPKSRLRRLPLTTGRHPDTRPRDRPAIGIPQPTRGARGESTRNHGHVGTNGISPLPQQRGELSKYLESV